MFRHGQWVKFDGRGNRLFEGAFRARDGKVVGIFQAENEFSAFKVPAKINVVNDQGENVDIMQGGMLIPISVGLNQEGLEPVRDRRDIPSERIKHLPENWQPRA